jgi:hypothetical protein
MIGVTRMGSHVFLSEQAGQRDDRHPAAADRGDECVAELVQPHRVAGRPQYFFDRRTRHGENLAAGADGQRRNDGERQRYADGEAHALAGLLSTSMRPPIRSIFARTTSMPTPRPEIAVTSCAVDRPASNIRAFFCAAVSRSARSP